MEVVGETLVWDRDVVGVVSDLVGVHHGCWNFDRSHEVEKVIAEVVGELLNLLL